MGIERREMGLVGGEGELRVNKGRHGSRLEHAHATEKSGCGGGISCSTCEE